MMQIKLRVRDMDDNKIKAIEYIKNNAWYYRWVLENGSLSKEQMGTSGISGIREQFSGLKDNSNPPKEIYEGDIVKITDEKWIVGHPLDMPSNRIVKYYNSKGAFVLEHIVEKGYDHFDDITFQIKQPECKDSLK